MQGLGECEGIAVGGVACPFLPACAQSEQPRARRDTDDADTVVGAGDQNSCDRGSVRLHAVGAVSEVFVDRHLSGEILMIAIDGAIEFGDPDRLAGRCGMQLRQLPLTRGRLQRKQRIVVGHAMEWLHRLRPGGARILTNCADETGHALSGRHSHHETFDAQRRHRPIRSHLQVVGACDVGRDPPPRFVRGRRAITLAIGHVRPKVRGRHSHHDQELLRCRSRRGRDLFRLRSRSGQGRRDRRNQQREQ